MRFIAVLTAFVLTFSLDLLADERQEVYVSEKNYDDMTSAELTKAKRLAEKVKIRPLVACADPGNLPLSSMEIPGFDNRIATLLAEKMGTSMRFFWRPFLERGLTRETFANRECDLLLGMPYGYQSLLTTMPIYRSTYVMAYPESKPLTINGLDDPKLRNIKIGTYQHSGLREALTRKGVAENIIVHPIRQDTDINPDHQQWRQLLELVSGELDAVGIWGPFAGYAKKVENAPIDYFPVNLLEDKTPLEFSLAIGMRKNDVILKYALDKAITENAQEIADILTEYGVPLVACSQCAVQGELPSHGSYYQSFINEAESRYLAPLPKSNTQLDTARATEDQKVDLNKLKGWLAEGADLNEELSNAVLAADETRIRYLIGAGADINLRTSAGFTLAHETAKYRDSDTLAILLEQGIDKNAKDAAGWTPLIHGAYRNHVPTVALLASHKADIEAKTKNGYTALGLAIGERKFWAAKA
ncbi:ankyrin repeat domain-containing protein [Enterovibrio coralii]|uniref:Solute-binding protein family 3/N-terminal domain-containing protein n=1 Tax=Enterovibrio coralii TaxID=294935 RepID=A0A135IA78_9GAMM|nr:ankyrin repeat domain-containing protein [Enterovibrio coralii]KXF82337.1 hypothetical protein ATN88_09260 [Enterovibrio coralii]